MAWSGAQLVPPSNQSVIRPTGSRVTGGATLPVERSEVGERTYSDNRPEFYIVRGVSMRDAVVACVIYSLSFASAIWCSVPMGFLQLHTFVKKEPYFSVYNDTPFGSKLSKFRLRASLYTLKYGNLIFVKLAYA